MRQTAAERHTYTNVVDVRSCGLGVCLIAAGFVSGKALAAGFCRAITAVGGMLIWYARSAILFNPEPQATASVHAVACGLRVKRFNQQSARALRLTVLEYRDRLLDPRSFHKWSGIMLTIEIGSRLVGELGSKRLGSI